MLNPSLYMHKSGVTIAVFWLPSEIRAGEYLRGRPIWLLEIDLQQGKCESKQRIFMITMPERLANARPCGGPDPLI